MKSIKIILGLLMGFLGLVNAQAQSNTTTTTTKATALLSPSCQIKAQSVSFGSLSLPITTQQATSNMTVLCTKETAYTISMGTNNTIYLVVMNGNGHYYAYDSVTKTAGNFVTYDVSMAGCSSITDCVNNKGYTVYSNNVPSGSMGCNYPSCTVYTTSSFNGAMRGASKGDSIGYNIRHPSNNNPWTGTNTYGANGNGSNQTIPVVAQLLPGSSAPFPSPDMYTDTVTTTINF